MCIRDSQQTLKRKTILQKPSKNKKQCRPLEQHISNLDERTSKQEKKACKVQNSKTTLFPKCVEKIKKQMSYINTEDEHVTTDKSKQ